MIKQTLGWNAPKLRDPKAADNWTCLIIAAYTQLRLARPLAVDLRRTWERPVPKEQAHPGPGPPRVPTPARQNLNAGRSAETLQARPRAPTWLEEPPPS